MDLPACAASCKTRCFCPSCQAKQVAAFLEQALEEVLEEVDHRQLVWTIPRVLRPAFYKDRKLLEELCRCAWASLRDYVQSRLGPGSAAGAILTIQTWGEHLRPHAHLYGLVSDTAWNRDGSVDSIGGFDSSLLSRLFQHRVLEMMVAQHRLSPEFAERLLSWSPSGFGVYCSRPIPPEDRPALERLAAYIRRPSFAASRLDYDSDRGQILYRTAKGTLQSWALQSWMPWTGLPGSARTSPIATNTKSVIMAVTRAPHGGNDVSSRKPSTARVPTTGPPRRSPRPSASAAGAGAAGLVCSARSMTSIPCAVVAAALCA